MQCHTCTSSCRAAGMATIQTCTRGRMEHTAEATVETYTSCMLNALKVSQVKTAWKTASLRALWNTPLRASLKDVAVCSLAVSDMGRMRTACCMGSCCADSSRNSMATNRVNCTPSLTTPAAGGCELRRGWTRGWCARAQLGNLSRHVMGML